MIEERQYAGFLFDMDGTLLDSTTVIKRIWGQWAASHGYDPERFIEKIHGIRAEDVLSRLALPDLDIAAEARMILAAETADLEGIVPIAGVLPFLAALPRDRWAIVTSAPRELALRRLGCVGIPIPEALVTAEDVAFGKPDPECYKLGAKRLGLEPSDCLVFEDAAAGIAAGEAAGCDVVVVAGGHGEIPCGGRRHIDNYLGVTLTLQADEKYRLIPRSDAMESSAS